MIAKTLKLKTVLPIGITLILTHLSWAAIEDTNAPQLLDLTIAPTVIDTSISRQEILVRVRLREDLSGFSWLNGMVPSQAAAWAQFRSPIGGSTAPTVSVGFYPDTRESGDEFDGVYTNSLVFPRYSHAGTWTLVEFGAYDAVGNHKQVSYSELRRLGLPTQITVQGVDDREPPSVVSAAISPSVIHTSASNRAVVVSVHLHDNLSGMPNSLVDISFVSPSSGQYIFAYFGPQDRASGDELDGVYTNAVRLAQYSEPGLWVLDSLRLVDVAGNQQTIDLARARDQGLPLEFTVEGVGDTTPPTIREFDFVPRRIDTSRGSSTVRLTARLIDALSGMSNSVSGPYFWGGAWAFFMSPSTRQMANVAFDMSSRTAGDEFDGVYTGTLLLPRYSETGIWTLYSLSATDASGNTGYLQGAELCALGFPTQLAVGISPSLTIRQQGDSILLSWPAWASNFTLQSRTESGQPGAWTNTGIRPLVLGETALVAIGRSVGSAGGAFYRLCEKP